MRIAIHSFGDIPFNIMKELAADLRQFNAVVDICGVLPIPPQAYDEKRRQYIADVLLTIAGAQNGDKILCVAPFDMYSRPLNFVFGVAEMGGKGAIVSIARLGSENRQTLRDRVAKEAVHELGHTLGLGHCSRPTCVMHFSNNLADTDYKNGFYCEECCGKIPTAWTPKQRSPGSC